MTANVNDSSEAEGGLSGRFYAIQECLRSALLSIRAHGLRSFLTMLGIVIGVASVICVISLVQGLSSSIASQFQALGGSTLTLRSYTPMQDQLRGKLNRLRPNDLAELQFRVNGISNITPMVFAGRGGTMQVRYGANTATGQMFGTNSRYQDVQRIFPQAGRFLTDSDDANRRRVVVIGEQMRRDLKLPRNPAGEFIQIGNEWFKVVGLMEARGELFGISQDNYLLMPFQTALAIGGIIVQPDLWITFTVDDPEGLEATRQQVTMLMRRLHQLGKDQPNDFRIEAPDMLAKTFEQVMTTVTLVVAGIVGISLLVGGVGIMNIMLVSVTERTREIGIAKALGAPRQYILMQFLIESVVLAVIGGVIGIAIGFGLGYGVASLIPNFPPPSAPWWSILGACTFSALVGIVFGILPASKAANLTPIDALRYE